MAIFWAISKVTQILYFLTTILVVEWFRFCKCGFYTRCTPTSLCTSMGEPLSQRDECVLLKTVKAIYRWPWEISLSVLKLFLFPNLIFLLQTMTENIRSVIQDIVLGSNDVPLSYPLKLYVRPLRRIVSSWWGAQVCRKNKI